MIRTLVAAAALAGTSQAQGIALNWFPEAEHGGFYAAQAAGLYKAKGLDIKLVAGGPGAPVLQEVATGRVEFGVSNADEVLIARSQGVPVVAVLAPIQTSPRVIMVHEESGITSLAQLKDLTLAIEPQAPFSAWMKKKLPLEGVRFVPYSGSVAPFLSDKKWAQQAYGISEPFAAIQKGAKVRNLLVSDLGYNPYTSVLVVSEKTLREKPEMVAKVVEASKAGWDLYLQDSHPADAAIRSVNKQVDQPLLDFGHGELLKLCRNADTQAKGTGIMTAARWDDLRAQLVALGTLKADAEPAAKAWTDRFLVHP